MEPYDAGPQRRTYERDRGMAGRAAGAAASQALSSVQNFTILFVALRTLEIRQLGAFTMAYTTAPIVLVLVRALVLEPLTIRFTEARRQDLKRATESAAGLSLAVGLTFLGVCLVAGVYVGGAIGAGLAAFGFLIPILLVQDAWRFHFFASGRAWAAVVNDGVCLAGTVALVVYSARMGDRSVESLLRVWAYGTGLGAAVGMLQIKAWPNLRTAGMWLAESRSLGGALAGEKGIELISSQLALALVGVVVTVSALGLFGAARTLMAPVTTGMLSLTIFALPEGIRLQRLGTGSLKVFTGGLSLLSAVGVAAYTAAVYMAPENVMRLLAGENWNIARSLLFPVALWSAALAVRQGASIGLRALSEGRAILRLSAATSPAVLAASIVGGAITGAEGAAWGFASAYCASTVGYWLAYLRLCARVARGAADAFAGPVTDGVIPRETG